MEKKETANPVEREPNDSDRSNIPISSHYYISNDSTKTLASNTSRVDDSRVTDRMLGGIMKTQISFAEAVRRVHSQLLLGIKSGDPSKLGFHKNTRGCWEKIFECSTYDPKERIGKLRFYFAEQNPNGRSNEAKAVKSGKYQPYEIGWLWTYVNGSRKWIAKSTPEGCEGISDGIFSKESGTWTCRIDK